MSNEVENQIVSMQFDNKQFEPGVATSLSTIDKLNKAMQFPDAGKGLEGVNSAVRGFNVNPMTGAIHGISKAWLGMTTVAVTAIANVTNKAVDAGLRLAKSFAIDPILAGFHEYETNLNSVQTIMANTGENVGTVNKYLQELNHYSDKTIYNFSEMARNIGTFTAAGVDLKTSTASIKGIANLAAVSGSSSQQASTAMYQLSQALASGKVGLQDWNSVVNAGMGGKVFQTALVRTAQNMGAIDKESVKMVGPMKQLTINGSSFRDSISAKPGQTAWLTSGVLTETLKQLSGNMTRAQLAAQGYTKAQQDQILAMAKTAQEAATRVKTFSQLIGVIREAVGSGWAKIFQDLFGNFKEASTLWTSVSNTITGAISRIFGSVDKMLLAWRKAGGYVNLWEGIKNVFLIIGNILGPFVRAFQSIIPSAGNAGSTLGKLTQGFADFTGFLVKVTDGLDHISPNLSFLGKGFKALTGFVMTFMGALKPLIPILQDFGNYVGDLFNQGMSIAGNLIAGWTEGLDPAALQKAAVDLANDWIDAIKNALGIHSPATSMVPIGLNIIQGIVEGLLNGANVLISALQKIVSGIGQVVKAAIENISWSDVLDTINTGLFVGVFLLFRNFVKAFSGTMNSFRDLMDRTGGVMDQLTSNLKTMQQKVKSEVIRNIAISVALLAASALLLSTVDGKKLGVALGAIAGLMTSLIVAMKVLMGGTGKKGLDPKTMAKQTAQIVALGAAMIEFSTAILILTSAVALMGQLDQKTIERGLAGIAGVIAIITTATAILGKTGGGGTILATATAMIVLAAALTAFVGVMKLYEQLDWQTLIRGGGAAAAVILGVGLAMRGFGKGAIGGSVGLVIASAALLILAKAMQQFAAIGLGDMIKAVVALDIILGSIAAAALAMSVAEGGAGSMLVFAAALIVLAKSLEIIAGISIGNIIKALLTLTVALALIAGAAILLTPAVPLIAALGTALLLLGAAVLAAGLGVLAFATAMGILAVVGPAAFQALHDGITQLLETLPLIGEALGETFVSFLTGIVKAAGPLASALGKLIGILIDELIKLVPKVGDLVQKVVHVILRVIANNYVNAAKVMIGFILKLLTALNDGIPKIAKKGEQLILTLMKEISDRIPRLVDQGFKMIIKFINGIAKAIRENDDKLHDAGVNLAKAIAEGVVTGLLGEEGLGKIKAAAEKIADALPGWMKKVLHIGSPSKVMEDEVGRWAALGVAQGINNNAKHVEAESKELARRSLDAMRFGFKNAAKAGNGLGDLKPKITPVLDLSRMSNAASQISAKMGSHSVDLATARHRARDISSAEQARHGSGGSGGEGDEYNFYQTINSPKPVNHRQVYRGTNSQIALLKATQRR